MRKTAKVEERNKGTTKQAEYNKLVFLPINNHFKCK